MELKMERTWKRKKYLIHPSSQLKYIGFSVIPALIVSLVCTYFLIKSGELIFQMDRERLLVKLYSINQTSEVLEKEGCDMEKTRRLKNDLLSFKNMLEKTFLDTPKKWHEMLLFLFVILACVLLFTGLFALSYSHRMAGPIYRIRSNIDMLSEGIDISPIALRKHDEFKEIAESLDKLRMNLKQRGLLESRKDDRDT